MILMKIRFVFTVLFFSFFSFFFLSSSVLAVGKPSDFSDFKFTDKLIVKASDKDEFDFTTSYYSKIINSFDSYQKDEGIDTKFITTFNNSLNNGSRALIQYDHDFNGSREISIYYSQSNNQVCDFRLSYVKSQSAYFIRAKNDHLDNCRFNRVSLYYNKNYDIFSVSYSEKIVSILISGKTGYFSTASLFLFSDKYSLDDSMQGYDPVLPDSIDDVKVTPLKKIVSPEFDYKITDKKIELTHRKDKDEFDFSAFSKIGRAHV